MTDASVTHGILVRPVAAEDETAWSGLYRGYASFYRVEMTQEILATTWSWLMADQHPLEGLVAVRDGQVVGLAHYRAQPRPLYGAEAGFLDDLFVDPACRRAGIARQLIAAVNEVAVTRGWRTLRWITAKDNAAARQLYDQLAAATDWVTYEIRT